MKKLIALVIAGLTLGLAPAAVSQEAPSAERDIETLRRRCIEQIDARLVRIDRLQEAVASSESVSPSHEATLDEQLLGAETGLTELKAVIEAEDDLAELRRECRSIIVDYRIYVLVTPRTLLTLAADETVSVAATFSDVAARIQAKIDEYAAAGRDVRDAQAEHDSMVAHIAAASRLATGVPDAVLPLTPADWPRAQSVLRQAHRDLDEARGELRKARQDAKDAIEALRTS